MIIRACAYPRAALVGNPSDGYFGKTIAFTFRNFEACATLYESPELEIVPCRRDHSRFASVQELAEDVKRNGYYGGVRLIKASIKSFHDHCASHGVALDDRNFTVRYETSIPSQVGLAGSSAIITACFRALMQFYGIVIEEPLLANLVLSVEARELGIPAGLQDRVAQAYDGLVYMDFDRALMEANGCGRYERLDADLLPPLYIAYRGDLAEGTEIFHGNFRERWNSGEPEVVAAMRTWADLTDRARAVLVRGDRAKLGALINENFDLRRRLCRLSPGNLQLVDTARAAGASAHFTGSGGAIVGAYDDERMFRRLNEKLSALGVQVFKPDIVAQGVPA